jgi:hypothetical protein
MKRLGLMMGAALLWASLAWGATPTAEMRTVSTTALGPTAALCESTPAGGSMVESGANITILDQPIWYTTHGPAITPSSTLGALGSPGTTVSVDRASDFRAIRQGSVDSRLYIVCSEREPVEHAVFNAETLVVSGSVSGTTADLCKLSKVDVHKPARMQVITGSIYYAIHDAAATPSATLGFRLSETPDQVVTIPFPPKLRMVRGGGSDARVVISCIR